jgi:ankyrin repeat protein
MRSGFDNACREGNIDIVKYLVSNKYAEDEETISGGIYSTISSGLKNPVLHYLISLNKVKKLPGLVLAVHLNNLDMIKFLVSNGADINERDGWNIISSAEKKNWDILKYFADNKGNVRARDDKILKMKHLPEDIRDYILKK